MTVEEMRKEKAEAESQVREILERFTKKTGMNVDDIGLELMDFKECAKGAARVVMKINITARL